MIAHAARGDYAAVDPLFDLLFLGVDQKDQPTPDLPIYLFYAGRVRWLQACARSFEVAQEGPGRNSYLEHAREIYDQMCALTERDPQFNFPEVQICCIWMRSLLDVADARFEQAERALRQPEILEQTDRDSTIILGSVGVSPSFR